MNASQTFTVALAGNGSAYRWLAVGSAAYIAGIVKTLPPGRLTLGRIGPNPLRGALRIGFTVPYSGIDKVRCEIIDTRGRTIWSQSGAGKF